jgi:hypothetical protein
VKRSGSRSRSPSRPRVLGGRRRWGSRAVVMASLLALADAFDCHPAVDGGSSRP